MRVFSASLATETNTFGPMPTSLASFRDRGYFKPGEHPDHPTLFTGPLWAARLRGKEAGWTLIEGTSAGAQPSGITTRHAYETLREEILADLRAALPVDIVLLGLHGAMVADGYDDCEGDIITRVREIVGPGVVVGAELDPHCHISPAMREGADFLVTFKEYPHTDVVERGLDLVDLCVAKVEGKIRPVHAIVDTEMIVKIRTPVEPARSFVDRIKAMEGRDGVLSISIGHGFQWGDVPDMGTRVLVYTDNDPGKAQALARKLADELNALRDALSTPMPDIEEALDRAMETSGTVILADSADNPGGGAAGDSTFILKRLIERGIAPAAVGPMWDPVAVRIACDAGVGATLALRIGGKISPASGMPIDLVCTVKAIQPNMQMTGLTGTPMAMGDCVLVESQGVEIVLTTLRNQAMGTDVFTNLGCDLAAKKIIVVKSSQHFYASFSKVTQNVIYVSAPGAVACDITTLPYRNIRRPKWPLDA